MSLSRNSQRRIFLISLVTSDIVALWLAFNVSYILRFYLDLVIFDPAGAPSGTYLSVFLVLLPVWLLIFYLFQLYNYHDLLGGTREYGFVLNATTLGIMLIVVVSFFGQVIVARGWIILFWFFATLFIGIFRFLLRRLAYSLRQRGLLRVPTLVVGADAEGIAIANQLREAQTCGADIIGFLDDQRPIGEDISGVSVLGRVAEIKTLVDQHNIGEVLLSTTALTRPQIVNIYEEFGAAPEIELRISPGLFEILTTGAHVKEWGYVPLVSINKVRLNDMESWIKAVMDYGISLVGLVILSPILLLVALAVKSDSPGPVLYRRRVMGRGGREFDAFKFRTMYMNGDEILSRYPELREELKAEQKLRNDPRVTRLGQFLRRYSIDELPQLFNVLLGQMSWVGPRMITPAEVEKYGRWKMNLLTVKPGITGLWQISGRSDVAYGERVRLDMYYIRNYTFWLDLFILFRTIPAVLHGRGAY